MKRMARAPWEDDPRLNHTPGSLFKALFGGVLFAIAVWVLLIGLFSLGPA